MNPTPSFGTFIRASRLGWGRAQQHGCFIRMSDHGADAFKIELCPLNSVPSGRTPDKKHRCWWEGPGPSILEMIPWLKGIRSIKRYVAVIVGEDGTILKELTK